MFHYIRNKLTQAQIIAMGYFLVITVGTLLLMLPAATRSGEMATPLTALFTATSATCVTGLVVVDTASYWSVFGQCIILLMIQVGGVVRLVRKALIGTAVIEMAGALLLICLLYTSPVTCASFFFSSKYCRTNPISCSRSGSSPSQIITFHI